MQVSTREKIMRRGLDVYNADFLLDNNEEEIKDHIPEIVDKKQEALSELEEINKKNPLLVREVLGGSYYAATMLRVW